MTNDDKVLYFYERNNKSFVTPNLTIAIARSQTNEIKAKITNLNGQSYTRVMVMESEI